MHPQVRLTCAQRGCRCNHRLDRQRRRVASIVAVSSLVMLLGSGARTDHPASSLTRIPSGLCGLLRSGRCNLVTHTHNSDPVGFETDIVSSEGGGATSDTDVRPHSLGQRVPEHQLRAENQQLRIEIQRLEQRYAQTVSSMTQERQEALANEAAFTRMARDSSQQLQLKLADAESKIEFLVAFISSQVLQFSACELHATHDVT